MPGTLALALSLVAAPTMASPIAVVADGPSDLLDERIGHLRTELAELTRDGGGAISIDPKRVLRGAYDLPSARARLRAALEDPDVRLVLGFGFFTGIAARELSPHPSKPIFLPFASPELQDLPRDGPTSGRKNLGYLTGLIDIEADVARFREVVRDRRVLFLVSTPVLETLRTTKAAQLAAAEKLRVRFAPLARTAEQTLASLPADVEAIYLPHHFYMGFGEMEALIRALNARKIPTYAGMGPAWVDKGAFVTLVPRDLETERFRRVALDIRDALAGDRVEDMWVAFPRREQLYINMVTARQIGVYPSFDLMTEAQVVSAEDDEREVLGLRDTIGRALERNPSYRSTDSRLRAAEAELRESRGNLFPKLQLHGSFTWIDEDIASTLQNAERQVAYGAQAQQVIYEPLAVQGYLAQQQLLQSVEQARHQAMLDLVLETIQSYLGVLQTRAVETLNRTNLTSIRRNRGLAQLRVEIGTSARQDVARWNIELANRRAETIAATARRNQAEIDLNRILAVELERRFRPELPEAGPRGLIVLPELETYVGNPHGFRIFRDFMAKEARSNAPELATLDSQIDAQNKLLDGYLQRLYIPSLGVAAGFDHVLGRYGAGAGASPDIPGLPQRDDFTWRWGLDLQFTLWDDTRYGTIERIRQERDRLLAQREDVGNRVEQRVRSALHQAGASGAAVSLREDAVAAARVNLEAVASAYREGTTNIITLIDAQDRSLQTEIAAANAVYAFLSDFAAASRAAGAYPFLADDEERAAFLERLRTFAKARPGVNP